jgi:hypothetical protein
MQNQDDPAQRVDDVTIWNSSRHDCAGASAFSNPLEQTFSQGDVLR